MDILRKELNAIYAAQHLDSDRLNPWTLHNVGMSARILFEIEAGCTVITDIAADRSYLLAGDFGPLMGLSCEVGRTQEIKSSDEDEVYARMHPDDTAARWTDPFYMTGDFENASIDFKPEYADAGFSSLVNFHFPKQGDLDAIAYVWQAYADSLAAHPGWHPFSYLNNSYHRDADPENMTDCATTLLLAPGATQIFYGDETGRKLSDARLNVDSNQAFRSDMNWDDIDSLTLDHFRRLGTIRKANPVIATGHQRLLDAHTVLRYNGDEKVLIRLRPEPGQPIDVYGVFCDGDEVIELYTGARATVRDGRVLLPAVRNRLAILRKP